MKKQMPMLQVGMMNINYDQLKKYEKDLKEVYGGIDNFLKSFLIEMAERVIAKTKPRTPVDTGSLRNAWGIETSKTSIEEVKDGDKIVKRVIQEGDIVFNGNEVSVILSNPMEYATEIEYGHRIVSNGMEVGWYEGRFMLKISIEEVQRQLPARYAQKFTKFLKEKGIDTN